MKIIHGKVENVLPTLADSSVDCIVTDPPYELGFMGKKWDSSGIAYSVAMWAECLRVLKPGGHLLSFSGSRTYHRMTCAIEDAGFEVRDQIMWIYGSGFPKSMDVSKAIDKAAGAERERIKIPIAAPTDGMYGKYSGEVDSNEPITAAAAAWQGWGTALKPAHEPICVARKPLIGTVADNVLQYGAGAINIDACRVENVDADLTKVHKQNSNRVTWEGGVNSGFKADHEQMSYNPLGRFPANLIFDEEAGEILDQQAPSTGAAAAVKKGHNGKSQGIYGDYAQKGDDGRTFRNDVGGASRFFYCAKASKADRGVGNDHPTVKPTTLMQYLAKLVCPPGGVLLDPFAGSGSTLKACELEGIKAVGIDQELHHVKIITSRVNTCVIVVDGIEMDRDTFEMLY